MSRPLNLGRPAADVCTMIRMRFVALLGVFALLLAGYGAYLQSRPGPAFVGATDPEHIAASEAMLKSLATPAGMTLDPYGTNCGIPASYCFISNSVEPETASAAETKALVAHGGRVRHHACGGADLIAHACDTVVDYQGSAIEVSAGPSLQPGNARTDLRLSVSGADGVHARPSAAPYGSWASVDPFPAAWTTGVTCTRQTAAGCSLFRQPPASSPVISATTADACATVRRVMTGRYFLIQDRDEAATATDPGGCIVLGTRFRTAGGGDGEMLGVDVQSKDARHIIVSLHLASLID